METLLLVLGVVALTVFSFKVGVQYERNRINRIGQIALAFIRAKERQDRNEGKEPPPWN